MKGNIKKERKTIKILVNKDLISLSLHENESNLTEIINRTDKLHVKSYLLSPDTNKH